ncbi:hypothetical protein F3B77_24905 [Bacteroides ovatus]|nr:hypothetical protein F3D38_24715 [Bacteroides ovatus]KAA4148110.1 hypothetical protein F3D31_20995 [Bacteroides ovatus]KAA4277269.1 hypothetical protein F3D15_09895 [Bacteroides ovatus]KAA4433619.1 hypothetical protein F3C58_20710 [Bacteroides ovatus]KAA4445338.1 hypothetical protein F3C64_26060 [Bacteroides ovatus]
MALFLILSKSNSSFIKKTVLAKLILYSLLTQFNLHPPVFRNSKSYKRKRSDYYGMVGRCI